MGMVSWDVDGNNRRELRHGPGLEPYHPLVHAGFGPFSDVRASPAMFALLSNRDVDRAFPDVSNLPIIDIVHPPKALVADSHRQGNSEKRS